MNSRGSQRRSCCAIRSRFCNGIGSDLTEDDLGRSGALAALLGAIPRSRRAGLPMIVTPEKVLRWHRDIVRRRWAAKSRPSRPGRPPTHRDVTGLVLPLAGENPAWAYRRFTGARRLGSAVGAVDSLGDPASGGYLARAPTHRANVSAVPARPGRCDPGYRLLPRGPARPSHGLCPGGR